MLAALRTLVLILAIAVLPLQALAAIVAPLCLQDPPNAAFAMAKHTHQNSGHHDHSASAPGDEHPFTVNDFGSDHCGAGFASAMPMMYASVASAATAERSWFATASWSGFIPEQPQRPPLV